MPTAYCSTGQRSGAAAGRRSRKGHRSLALLALLALTAACEKTIDLDLTTSPTQLVVEAVLADDGLPAMASLRQTLAYDQPNAFPEVRGATVLLTDDAGGLDTLREVAPGRYQGRRLRGVVGRRYTLDVAVDGRHYGAASTLPAPVPLAGVKLEEITFGPNKRLTVQPLYTDPAGGRNYYYFRQQINRRVQKTIYLQDDEFTDGNANTLALRGGFDDDELKTGDTLRLELRNLDFGGYAYYRTLNQILGSNPLFTTTPANPTSTFTNGALGYFTACSVQRVTTVVP